jgi:type VI secretion system protein ImpJ
MTWTSRVIWQEGMFLRAQHFQQQDRWLDALVRGAVRPLRPYPWGLTELTLNRDLLATGRFAVASAEGIFEDGTPFSIPDEAEHPPPLELPENTRNALVYLALPIRQPGAPEVAAPDVEGRLAARGFEAYDTHSGSPQPAELQVGKLRLRYLLEGEERSGYHCIGVARVQEVSAANQVTLDSGWIPPALLCSAGPQLSGLIAEFAGMLNQRGDALAARMVAPGSRGVAEVSDFLLLQSINRWQKLLMHWAEAGVVHPEELYATFVQMAGEFATFTNTTSRRPGTYPAYRHEDLQRSFAPVVADLRKSLADAIDPGVVAIPLQERRAGLRVGPLTDRSVLRAAQFVLTAQADMPAEQLRRLFPAQVKIGAAEQIRDLVMSALPGIAVSPMPVAPRQLPFYAGAVYFELDRGSAHWQMMQNSGGFAIHVSGDFPNLRLELWAIRGTR